MGDQRHQHLPVGHTVFRARYGGWQRVYWPRPDHNSWRRTRARCNHCVRPDAWRYSSATERVSECEQLHHRAAAISGAVRGGSQLLRDQLWRSRTEHLPGTIPAELGFLHHQEFRDYGAPESAVHDRFLQPVEPSEFCQSGAERRGKSKHVRQDCFDGRDAAPDPVLVEVRVLTQKETPAVRIPLLEREQVAPEIAAVYDALLKQRGVVPNMFKTLAHTPALALGMAGFLKGL